MIVTVTMNPAVDRTVLLDHLEKGGLNRILGKKTEAGGKGINVSKTIKALGLKSIATGLIGGKGGKMIEKMMHDQGIETDFVTIEGNTRINIKVTESDGSVTELNETGPRVTHKELAQLFLKLDQYADEETLFVFSGSVPEGVPLDFYARTIEMVHEKGAKVFLDTEQDLLDWGLEARPDFLRISQKELGDLFEEEIRDEKRAAVLGARLVEAGIGFVAITQEGKGAIFLTPDFCVRCPGLKVPIVSAVGAWDGMVGALASGWEEGISFEAGIRLAMAVSSAAMTTEGTNLADQMTVVKLYQKVKFERI
ncbi:MAG: 1-phosphofructokinase family hexose kinase [Lachnospiraceae bacterium]|nr:1-phosphofructokinase family hexose kinase [Robinsoniella sp.]MDY3765891.1 1-phosphofructokinase family hexose kinase [Lachnospiraceae bacterium]